MFSKPSQYMRYTGLNSVYKHYMIHCTLVERLANQQNSIHGDTNIWISKTFIFFGSCISCEENKNKDLYIKHTTLYNHSISWKISYYKLALFMSGVRVVLQYTWYRTSTTNFSINYGQINNAVATNDWSVLLIFLAFCVVLCFCVLFFFVVCLVWPMLPVSLDCSYLIALVFFNIFAY